MKPFTVRCSCLITGALLLALGGCSVNQLAVDVLADTLAGGDGGAASVFTADPDPELVGDALPFALKLYETILQQSPDHEEMLLATGSGFISYANAFVAMPASMLPFEEFEQQLFMQQRAKALYLRGRGYLIHGLDVRYPGFEDAVFAQQSDALEAMLPKMTQEDVPFLYWIGAGWVAAFALDTFDLELAFSVTKAELLMLRALELDSEFNDGAIHSFLLQYYAALPVALGGSRERAELHYAEALRIGAGRLAGPYLSYAESIVIGEQDVNRFVTLMEQTIAVDVDAYPPARLLNTLSQRKARWYLENLDEFFLLGLPIDESGDATAE